MCARQFTSGTIDIQLQHLGSSEEQPKLINSPPSIEKVNSVWRSAEFRCKPRNHLLAGHLLIKVAQRHSFFLQRWNCGCHRRKLLEEEKGKRMSLGPMSIND